LIGSWARGASVALLLGLTACSTQILSTASVEHSRVELSNTPFFPQRQYQCGPAALATVLNAAGASVTADDLVHEVYIAGRKGSLQSELLAATRRHGRMAYVLDPSLPALIDELDQGRPVLVLQNFGMSLLPIWHYAVLIGYDRERDTVLLRNGRDERHELAARRFMGTWDRADSWAFIALRPGEVPATADARRFLDAAAALETSTTPAAATPAYEAARDRWPSDPLVLFAFANNRLALEQNAAAEEAYRDVISIDSGNIPARNNLALLMARRGCVSEARAVLGPARQSATSGPLMAELADTARQIDLEPAVSPACDAK
jgi:Peptidase_C39 like family